MAPDGALSREVALRKESVDRNFVYTRVEQPRQVALRKESVDRNVWRGLGQRPRLAVALRKESVDRNKKMGYADRLKLVALRKESVDRNMAFLILYFLSLVSLSARRAWIEIAVMEPLPPFPAGSLSARRAWIEMRPGLGSCATCTTRRSPQGERG